MTTSTTHVSTVLERNKALVRRFIDEIFLKGDFGAVDELLTDDFTPHTWGDMKPGRDGLKEAIARVSAGLSDTKMTIDDVIAEGDRVAVRLTSSATQSGDFMGMPPSGKRYEIGEIHIFRLREGRVAEHWHQADFMGMMRQLGATPQPR
ncbi:MAG: ester cyclase [Chloroflexota bacterium]